MAADQLREAIEYLASIDRASCSPGEHEAAEWIAAELRSLGADAEVEHHEIHGTYWWPLGLTSAGGMLAARLGRRGRSGLGALLGALSTALVVDELGAGRRWLRRVLPKRTTANVVAWMGDLEAEQTLLLVAHHDAAHTGIFFNPAITDWLGRHASKSESGGPRELPAPNLPIAIGPALAGLAALGGSRRMAVAAELFCAGIIGSFAHIAASPTVPGANDNLTGVAVLLAVARALSERPVTGLRVGLVSTGAEESLMEGMRAFAKRHFPALAPDRTRVLCVDAVGSPHLVLVEAEGMLEVRPYDSGFKGLIAQCAREAGVALTRGYIMRLGTDGYLALRNGLPAACLMSVNDYGVASNYHWPTDTADRIDYATLNGAVWLCEAVTRRLAETTALRPGARGG